MLPLSPSFSSIFPWIPMETAFSSSGFTTPIPFFMLIYVLVYIFGYTKIFNTWGPKLRLEASSCFMSLAHGTPAIFLSVYAILSSPNQVPTDFTSPNTPPQKLVLDYSTAYFIIDLIHYLVFVPNEALFIIHHVATLYVLITCRYLIQHGALPILVLLILAEVTSACQNVWTIAGLRRHEVAEAARLYDSMSPGFYTLYTITRGILAPLFTYRVGVFFVKGGGSGLVPAWAWVSWIVVISGGILVSWLWVGNLWAAFCRESKDGQQKEK